MANDLNQMARLAQTLSRRGVVVRCGRTGQLPGRNPVLQIAPPRPELGWSAGVIRTAPATLTWATHQDGIQIEWTVPRRPGDWADRETRYWAARRAVAQ